jgi:geranylgeranyl diphosphate synthase type 3
VGGVDIRVAYTVPPNSEQLLELHRGQGMDIYWRDACICPTEEEYQRMVLRSEREQGNEEISLVTDPSIHPETGGLFTLALRLMQLFSQDKRCGMRE